MECDPWEHLWYTTTWIMNNLPPIEDYHYFEILREQERLYQADLEFYGINEYDDEHLLRICKISGVDDFVGAHPKGYDLEIKERGVGLSGGQRQTINLARSLIHDPKILLLDEPTSSMDQGTEKKVVNSLAEACKDKTMLIVTHRNPIFLMVDRVLVLENGQIVADQTPEQLGIKKGA